MPSILSSATNGRKSDKKHPEAFFYSLATGKNWTTQSYHKQFVSMLQRTDLFLKVMITWTSQQKLNQIWGNMVFFQTGQQNSPGAIL